MSLLLVYHDKRRALIASDDRMTHYDETGVQHALPERVSKFTLVGSMILGCVGRVDLSSRLRAGTVRMATAQQLALMPLSRIIPHAARQMYVERRNINVPAHADKLDVCLLGFDERIRSFVYRSEDNFATFETTGDSSNRIFALGAFDLSTEVALRDLTQIMKLAKQRHLNWVAAELRDCVNELSDRHPLAIGRASYYTALDCNGTVPLAPEFTPAPPEEVLQPVAAVSGEAGRFYLGSIATPKATAPDTLGNSDGGTGAQSGMVSKLHMQAVVTNGLGGSGLLGNGAVTNLVNITDGDATSYGTLTVTGNGSGNEAIVYASGIPGITRGGRYATLKLKIRLRNVTNNLTPNGALATFTVATTTTGPSGSFTTQVANVPPATQSLTVLEYDLPTDVNPSQVGVLIGATAYSSQNSGSCVVDIYECWIEGVE